MKNGSRKQGAGTGRGALAALLIVLAACSAAGTRASESASTSGSPMNGDGWRSLVDPSLSAWRGYKSEALPAGWRAEDGAITKDGEVQDLISRDEFGDFELAFDWKVSAGGNAGIFYRATEEYEHPYWSGPEYQLLDDAGHPDGANALTSAAAAYGLYAPPRGVVKPAGEWNAARIVVRGKHVEHWLNGQKVVEYELGSPDWEAKVKASKFGEWPNYGRAARGRIGIQGDHPGLLAIRNARIRAQ